MKDKRDNRIDENLLVGVGLEGLVGLATVFLGRFTDGGALLMPVVVLQCVQDDLRDLLVDTLPRGGSARGGGPLRINHGDTLTVDLTVCNPHTTGEGVAGCRTRSRVE